MAYNKETGMYEGYIYKIINDINDKVYVGQTINTINSRFSAHKSSSKTIDKRECALYRAMRKYGVDHFAIVEVAKYISDKKENLLKILNEKEIFWISKFNSYIDGYNETKGGENVSKKNLISVDQYTLDGTFIKTYDSIMEASRETSVHDSSITMCANKHNKTGGGYIWTKHGEPPILNIKPTYSKCIKQYDLNLNFIAEYECVTDAERKTGISRGGISAVLNKCDYSCKGYIWVDENHEVYTPKQRHRRIFQYNSLGEYISDYKTAKEAQDLTGISSNSILLNCHGVQLSAGYYIWRFENESFDKYDIPSKMRPVCIIDENNTVEKIFCSIKDGAKYFNLKSTSNIYQSIKLGVKCHNYYWKYYEKGGIIKN